ncbi:AAA family ATPase [Rhodococcus sp. BP22]|uniref:AAA family ATPase n=1 Tax=Rhodococcus sp. BP22 TaxID=2758566 RepID=UPI001645B78C|nr:AAA family ATPase [Rhodococcus sp. BP22]
MRRRQETLTFFVAKPARQLPKPPYVKLRPDNWDDYGFQTLYSASLRTDPSYDGDEIELGNLKILRLNQQEGRPGIEDRFDELGTEFCSIGQSIEYYETLMQLPSDIRRAYLVALRDAVSDSAIEKKFENEHGWTTSLLRFGQALNTLKAGRKLLQGSELSKDQMSFDFAWRRDGHTSRIPFVFDDSGNLPGRCNILIGYNGVGKTTLLADLALAASRGADEQQLGFSEVFGQDTTFGAVVAISYSAFDTFETPESILDIKNPEQLDRVSNAAFGYVYCGLRRQTGDSSGGAYELKAISEIENEFVEALDEIGRLDNRHHLISAFQALASEPSFGQAGIDLTQLGVVSQTDAIESFKDLSTGHKVVLNIVTQLATYLRTRSLVLIDEPETHLHPPLVAALLRAIQVLLTASHSFAVIATHSPVVVQEIPAQFVHILEREADGPAILRQPEIETFAENIGAITRHVFSLDNSATDYQGILRSLAENYSAEEIDEMFGGGLSVQGRALVANYRNQQ